MKTSVLSWAQEKLGFICLFPRIGLGAAPFPAFHIPGISASSLMPLIRLLASKRNTGRKALSRVGCSLMSGIGRHSGSPQESRRAAACAMRWFVCRLPGRCLWVPVGFGPSTVHSTIIHRLPIMWRAQWTYQWAKQMKSQFPRNLYSRSPSYFLKVTTEKKKRHFSRLHLLQAQGVKGQGLVGPSFWRPPKAPTMRVSLGALRALLLRVSSLVSFSASYA